MDADFAVVAARRNWLFLASSRLLPNTGSVGRDAVVRLTIDRPLAKFSYKQRTRIEASSFAALRKYRNVQGYVVCAV